MRAVMKEASPDLLAWREKTGVDKFDEVWEGELHVNEIPGQYHQELRDDLLVWLKQKWHVPGINRVHSSRNVSDRENWRSNYRGPDIMLMDHARFQYERGSHVLGPPLVIVEICFSGDESFEKLPFYASLGVPEVWIIDQDSREPEIYVLSGGEYALREADADGWIVSKAAGVDMRQLGDRLGIRLHGNDGTYQELPED